MFVVSLICLWCDSRIIALRNILQHFATQDQIITSSFQRLANKIMYTNVLWLVYHFYTIKRELLKIRYIIHTHIFDIKRDTSKHNWQDGYGASYRIYLGWKQNFCWARGGLWNTLSGPSRDIWNSCSWIHLRKVIDL